MANRTVSGLNSQISGHPAGVSLQIGSSGSTIDDDRGPRFSNNEIGNNCLTALPSSEPPRLMTGRPAGPGRRTIPWLIGISAVVTGMVWFTLWQIQTIAIDNARTPTEAAECIAQLPPDQQADPGDQCSTEPNIILAAQNPIRNSLIIFALCLTVGYVFLVLNRGRAPTP